MNNSRTFDWNDLKHFLAVARCGSTLAAAKELRVSQSTVHRRLDELERRLGRELVKRHPTGYRLTALGIEMRSYAERVEGAIHEFERRLAASVTELTGRVKVTCPEALGSRLMHSPLIEKFNRLYPDVQVEFLVGGDVLDLAKGQADIAIRAMVPTESSLVGRKIGESFWAVYASRSYIDRRGTVECIADLDRHSVILFDGELSNHFAARWLQSVAPHAKVAARSNNLATLLLAVKSGAGIAPMPMTVEERGGELVRLLGPIEELANPFYLLMHKDMRRTPRVRAFYDFLVNEVRTIRRILAGEDLLEPDHAIQPKTHQ